MGIVGTMTVDTLLRRIVEARGLVTAVALGVAVGADEWKLSQTMIKAHGLRPAHLSVTLTTGLSELLLMRVIVSVAAVAIDRRVRFVHRHDMTTCTIKLHMRTHQPEFRVDVVIEIHRGPGAVRVTATTVLSVQAFVIIIIAMTGVTITVESDFEDRFNMAFGAGNFGMRTRQLEA